MKKEFEIEAMLTKNPAVKFIRSITAKTEEEACTAFKSIYKNASIHKINCK